MTNSLTETSKLESQPLNSTFNSTVRVFFSRASRPILEGERELCLLCISEDTHGLIRSRGN